MYVFIVVQDLLKLATFNGISKHVRKGRLWLNVWLKKVELPQTAFEKAFYPKHSSSPESLRWLEKESALRKIHIHHAACGHGGERWVERAPVDGYNHETKTVFQYHGCHWHGCRKCYPHDRNRIITHHDQTREDRFKQLLNVYKSFELLATM